MHPGMDFDVLIVALIVVVVGGLGTLTGSFWGSLLIGTADTFGKVLQPDFSMALTFAVMAAVLLLRPRRPVWQKRGLADRGGAGAVQAEARVAGARLGRGGRWVLPAVLFALLVVYPFVVPPYLLSLLTEVLIYGIFAMSLDLILGYTGLVSFGHAAFFGVGAYAAGIAAVRLSPHMGLTLPLAVVAAALAALVIGYLSIRAGRHLFPDADPRLRPGALRRGLQVDARDRRLERALRHPACRPSG